MWQKNNKEELINENKKFIYNVVSSICKRRMEWENDDELSIALIAFNKAIDKFEKEKGNFYSYAKMLIKNSIIDYFRKNKEKYILAFQEDEIVELDYKNSINDYEAENERKMMTLEIIEFSKRLQEFGIELKDLVNNSPKHKDTRDELLNLAMVIAGDSELIENINKTKMLPIKKISQITLKKEKFVEKWRRYLIALIILLSNDEFEYIKSYLNIKVGDKID
ncbi:RNA polymerase sigma factor SigI [Caloramator mitchellensis]|uniref:RNA polymerase sigma factor SigI n=1 Tax=Caloramator mitchellensis TaxID=908809 RepID=A0A0R3JRT2_CALMK|nr:RNA polymerase sigma-I factor [Caloramator mitchellensis]KRQ86203.1 RNA polymerase sigma factor SigI [Caloramator mitchellensis]